MTGHPHRSPEHDHAVPEPQSMDPTQLCPFAAFDAYLDETERPLREWIEQGERAIANWQRAPKQPGRETT